MNKRRIVAVLAAVLLAGWYIRYWTGERVCNVNRDLKTTTIHANGRNVLAEVAREEQDKVQGLSDRNCLDEGKGMLFVYDATGDYCFWMKDMHFPIDMIWLDDDKKIVTIHANVEPGTYPKSFCPDKPAQYILELNSGAAKASEWVIGTKLDFSL